MKKKKKFFLGAGGKGCWKKMHSRFPISGSNAHRGRGGGGGGSYRGDHAPTTENQATETATKKKMSGEKNRATHAFPTLASELSSLDYTMVHARDDFIFFFVQPFNRNMYNTDQVVYLFIYEV